MRRFSRRSFLKQSLAGSVALWVAGGALQAHEYRGGGGGMPWRAGVADEPYEGLDAGSFLTERERATLDAFTARLIPTDETGPGAREANVVGFIDRELASFYGRGQRWYMEGPFPEPLDTQGYQSEQAPAQLVRDGIAALDAHCAETHEGRSFVALSEAEQDAVLSALEEEEVAFEALSAKAFFDFVLEITIEGFFCDPLYGGNRDMVGWSLVGFPGSRYDYRDFIHHNGAAIEMPPVGLRGRPGWTSQR